MTESLVTAGDGRHVVCRTSELPPGERRIVEIGGRSIGVFNVKGTYYALYNRCPHKGAPLCRGIVTDGVRGPGRGRYERVREGEIVRCPWHGWEFDITSGRSWFNPHRVRVRKYDVEVERLPDHVDTFPIEVEQEMVVLYLTRRGAAEATGGMRAS
jgi:3-phenylpropionate/trans-cinnamate dioxygenase ferredoxin subunit